MLKVERQTLKFQQGTPPFSSHPPDSVIAPEAPGAAHRRLDQSTEKGLDATLNHTHLLANLMTPGVSKSLTRSGRAIAFYAYA
jgi:hypothetical protein